jgi:2-polyprenyl-3-methyl-5-hydroxy-6-metoxy-1,4-benzoquinol methylase
MRQSPYYRLNYLPLITQDKNAAILDFGCGGGNMLTFLHAQGYTRLNGADICENDSWTLLNKQGIRTEKISKADDFLRSIPETYDLIIVKDVIYYFKDDEVLNIIQLLKQTLKPNGKILFEIVNGAVFTGPYVKYKDYHIRLILTEHSIKAMIKDAGLQLHHISGDKVPVTGVRSLLYIFMNALWRGFLRLVYFAERGFDDQNPRILARKIIILASKT